MRLFAAILLGKAISHFTKFLRIGGGSSAPGLYALKIYPSLVKDLSKNITRNVIITGTNGKTTTSKMLDRFAKEAGLKVIRNHTGSNLERGIASTLISNSHLTSGKLNFDLGIWELDEAAFNSIAPKLKPELIVFLNVFRDQLDRYGEIDSIVKRWCRTLNELSAETTILINGDDENILELSQYFKGKVQKFGVKGYKINGESVKHLKEKRSLDFEARDIRLNGLNSSNFVLTIHDKQYTINLPLPGLYHIYDFLAGFAIGVNLSFKPGSMVSAIKSYSPAFGRVEKLPFGYIFLIKNPAGATQVFKTIAPNIKPEDRLLLALNDNLADGTDVSWIWDAQFERLQITGNRLQIFISGKRSYDLAVRMKYAGFDTKQIIIEPDLKKALKQARVGLKGQLFILPTYTAMLELQSILAKAGIKKQYWKEES